MFLDEAKQEFNEAYLLRRLQLDNKMSNKNYKANDQKLEKLPARNSYVFDETVVTLDLTMSFEVQEIQVSQMLVKDLSV